MKFWECINKFQCSIQAFAYMYVSPLDRSIVASLDWHFYLAFYFLSCRLLDILFDYFIPVAKVTSFRLEIGDFRYRPRYYSRLKDKAIVYLSACLATPEFEELPKIKKEKKDDTPVFLFPPTITNPRPIYCVEACRPVDPWTRGPGEESACRSRLRLSTKFRSAF